VIVTGIVTLFDSTADSVALTVTGEPSVTGFGDADSDTVVRATPSSVIVTVTELGLPAACGTGRLAVFSATVNVSFSMSASTAVEIAAVPVVAPAVNAMSVSVPWSPGSAVPAVTVTGIVAAGPCPDRVAVTVTLVPSLTGFGDADRLTVRVASSTVIVALELVPTVYPVPAATVSVNVSSFSTTLSEQVVIAMVEEEVAAAATVTDVPGIT
jgi:hypothetical protein